MSVIAARALAVQDIPCCNEVKQHRHDVSLGLSGWAQDHARNALRWEDKFTMGDSSA